MSTKTSVTKGKNGRYSVALISDFLEESWPSMDLVSEMLYSSITKGHSAECQISQLRPKMILRASSLKPIARRPIAWSADRLINRFVDYPLWIRRHIKDFDVFHIVDQSYAQLIHQLPPGRTVVSCHDLDTFKCLLRPHEENRSIPFRLMMKRTLSGLSKASKILCVSASVRDELLSYSLVPPNRLSVVHNGNHPVYSQLPDFHADVEAQKLLGASNSLSYLLHVGSTIPRKGIDLLLKVFSEVRKVVPNIRLVRVGGAFTQPQQRLASLLGVADAITVMPHLEKNILAAVYRRASLLLFPSKAEGFGLPLVEAMACGCPVLVSDLPVLREVGGPAATFCTVNDIEAWTETVGWLLSEKENDSSAWKRRRDLGSAWAARFNWEQSAAQCVDIYKQVLERHPQTT